MENKKQWHREWSGVELASVKENFSILQMETL